MPEENAWKNEMMLDQKGFSLLGFAYRFRVSHLFFRETDRQTDRNKPIAGGRVDAQNWTQIYYLVAGCSLNWGCKDPHRTDAVSNVAPALS